MHTHYPIGAYYDSDCEAPGDDLYTIFSFNRRHPTFCHPDKLPYTPAQLASLARRGIAHPLHYYEHGGCSWRLKTDPSVPGDTCPWDSCGPNIAGYLIFTCPVKDLPRTVIARTRLASACISAYSSWCNGECYYVNISVVTDDGAEDFDGCSGFIGEGAALSYLTDFIASRKKDGEPFTVTAHSKSAHSEPVLSFDEVLPFQWSPDHAHA